MKLDFNKKKKKATNNPKSKGAKLTYQLNRIKYTKNRDNEISALESEFQRAVRQENRLNDQQSAKLKAILKKKGIPSLPLSDRSPLLLLSCNSSAQDDLLPQSVDYVTDTCELSFPIREMFLFVPCFACRKPVCTGAAGHIRAHHEKFIYFHLGCSH